MENKNDEETPKTRRTSFFALYSPTIQGSRLPTAAVTHSDLGNRRELDDFICILGQKPAENPF
jgi:hypothetical protein